MGWSIGFDPNWNRDVGYGVPAWCDHPSCRTKIDRGLAFVCGGDVFGGEHGCGLFFCSSHLGYAGDRRGGAQLCPRCLASRPAYKKPKPDHPEWIAFKLNDSSWAAWRRNHPVDVAIMQATMEMLYGNPHGPVHGPTPRGILA